MSLGARTATCPEVEVELKGINKYMPSNLVVSIPEFRGHENVGKVFYVSDTAGVNWNSLNVSFSNISAVFSSVTLALAATTAGEGDVIVLATDYTTAMTAADLVTAQTNGVSIVQAGKNIFGQWFADRATANTPQSTNAVLFTVTGRVKLKSLIGTVTTAIADTAQSFTVYARDASDATLGSISLAAATSIRNLVTNGMISLTGTLANSLVTSKIAAVFQAAPITLAKGSQIKLLSTASIAGKVQWHAQYEPLDPGARMFPA